MESSARQRSFNATSEMNVTPFLDILLVLLVTFMAVIQGKHRTLDVSLPVPCPAPCVSTHDVPIVLEVGPGGEYYINQRPVAGAALGAELRSIYAPRHDKILQVAGRKGALYADVALAIDIAKGAGVQAVGIVPKEVARR